MISELASALAQRFLWDYFDSLASVITLLIATVGAGMCQLDNRITPNTERITKKNKKMARRVI